MASLLVFVRAPAGHLESNLLLHVRPRTDGTNLVPQQREPLLAAPPAAAPPAAAAAARPLDAALGQVWRCDCEEVPRLACRRAGQQADGEHSHARASAVATAAADDDEAVGLERGRALELEEQDTAGETESIARSRTIVASLSASPPHAFARAASKAASRSPPSAGGGSAAGGAGGTSKWIPPAATPGHSRASPPPPLRRPLSPAAPSPWFAVRLAAEVPAARHDRRSDGSTWQRPA
eukprot:CAMPEP_0185319836 /NCGR_PEP_ID=MMETSP1363-20130426/53135_1 /TAXON_ID=38817 /ORGANISM="Gephyrocapsa oceanica, Strain RCC1303" /LENGTH=236 /DNA_ID=CAMNT_0027918219 /DNA_START=175 /DNA_END=883 /DNA_ORIENTATION=+